MALLVLARRGRLQHPHREPPAATCGRFFAFRADREIQAKVWPGGFGPALSNATSAAASLCNHRGP